MSKGKSKSKSKGPQVLDEKTSALVIAEYLDLRDVTVADIDFLETKGGPLTARQIALTFRISAVLGIPEAFAVAPRFQDGFGAVCELFNRAMKAKETA